MASKTVGFCHSLVSEWVRKKKLLINTKSIIVEKLQFCKYLHFHFTYLSNIKYAYGKEVNPIKWWPTDPMKESSKLIFWRFWLLIEKMRNESCCQILKMIKMKKKSICIWRFSAQGFTRDNDNQIKFFS